MCMLFIMHAQAFAVLLVTHTYIEMLFGNSLVSCTSIPDAEICQVLCQIMCKYTLIQIKQKDR